MASIVLSSVGSSVGGAVGGSIGSFLGSQAGRLVGGLVDNSVFGSSTQLQDRNGAQLADLGVQASTYGRMIPILYGNIRIAGNIIWSRPIRETVTTTTSTTSAGGKGGGGAVSQATNTFSYSVSIAIAICEGEIDEVVRIWADALQLDFSTVNARIYRGGEDQLPDSLIQAFEGEECTPAYRGLAYVVFEDFQLADYGNRIPNFTFEVSRSLQHPDYQGEITENLLKAITLIPGAGEFVYDTEVQIQTPGNEVEGSFVAGGGEFPINLHNVNGQANVLLSLDQLERTFPNLEWVSIVIAWFGTSLDAGECIVQPGVEYQGGGQTSPSTWQVAGFNRDTARLITQIDNAPQFGGTPSDSSVTNLIAELKSRGYKVMLYPIMFMDVPGKNWRGEVTGSLEDVAEFFTKTNGFNAFTNHYAALGATAGIDAFVIGSELVSLTAVTDGAGSFPAVDELVNLAAHVKPVLGEDVTVTYAADWSEYHHTDGGWYNLDPLWASPNIDVVGIDAYFPIKDSAENTYDVDVLRAGWTSGENYDYFYSDQARTIQEPLDEAFAIKNLDWFWHNTHVNPDGNTTPWVPESKKYWFTEFGFPSVDNAANQPNVFFDPTTVGSAFPYQSRGRVDFNAQRAPIAATLHEWRNSDMVEEMFLWTWDARPYPYWPDLVQVWSDGPVWDTGHWVQGKFGTSALAAIAEDLARRVNLADNVDVSRLTQQTDGYVIVNPQTVRQSLEQLGTAFLFDTVESDYRLNFIPRGQLPSISINVEDLALESRNQTEVFNAIRAQEIELPRRVNVIYLDRLIDYQPSTQYAERFFTESQEVENADIPIVLSDQFARNLADILLYTRWVERHSYDFLLSARYLHLEPGDVISVVDSDITHTMRITNTRLVSKNLILVGAVAEDIEAYNFYSPPADNQNTIGNNTTQPLTSLDILDIPALPSDDVMQPKLRYAASSASNAWRGGVLFRSDDGGESFNQLLDLPRGAVLGSALDALGEGPENVFDEFNSVTIQLTNQDEELSSITELALLNGANAALIGDEIVQFQHATLIGDNQFRLSRLLRGRQGTERHMASHQIAERFILLDSGVVFSNVSQSLLYLERSYRAVSVGSTLAEAPVQNFTYLGVNLLPLSPVHARPRASSDGDIELSWTRRTRGFGDWQDNVDIPLNETVEAYEVDVLDDSGDILRSIPSATPNTIYTLAEQIEDLGAAATSLTFNIYQLSSAVGRGFKAEVSYSN